MHSVFAQITTSQWPILFAIFAGAAAVVGMAAAWIAHASTLRDRKAIRDAEAELTSSESWRGAHTHSEHELSEWLQKQNIGTESGVADVIRACWSAWLGARATTLTELHVLVARRERSKAPARLSAGIAALLLVIGIVGTLFSIKPILKAFEFRVSTSEGAVPMNDNPALSNVAESTELVNSLMHSLGDAFLPSLVALIATIVLVAFRGMYSLGLNRYTLELDRFAMRSVMPHFRPRSISGEYEEVRTAFESLAKSIAAREEKFDRVVGQLANLVERVEPTLGGLDQSLTKISSAADALASGSNSIATTLTRTLGSRSPLYAAVNGFEGILARSSEELKHLSQHIDGVSKSQDEFRQQMLAGLDQLAKAIGTIGQDHKQDRQAVSSAIADVKKLVSDLPNQAIEGTREMFRGGLGKIESDIVSFIGAQKSEMTGTQRDLREKSAVTLESIRVTLNETVSSISESAKGIPETLEKLNHSLNRKTEVEKNPPAKQGKSRQPTPKPRPVPLRDPKSSTKEKSGLPTSKDINGPGKTLQDLSPSGQSAPPHENPPAEIKKRGFVKKLFRKS